MAVGDMSNSELIEEKVMIQKELLNLQSMFGRPNNKEDKDLVRPLYDRYRNLKRAISRTSSVSNHIELNKFYIQIKFFLLKLIDNKK